jgi:hypothetical protein
VDDYYKEMVLLLIHSGVREDPESKMARFFQGLHAEISGFVEMFPYNNLQDLVDQAMCTERKFSKRSMVDRFQQYHGINNSQIHIFLEVALRVLHQGVL